MIRFASVLLLLFLAGTQAAMAQAEIVIDVPDSEAQTILQSYAADELAYAETLWTSNGRIRLAKIDNVALGQSGVEVQFTPFADVAPIVMMSHGIDDHTWTGERVYNRIDGFDEHGQMADAIKNHPEMKKMGATVTDEILHRMATVNTVKLGIRQYLKDPNTGEFLLDASGPYADIYVINAQTGQLVAISGLESGYTWRLKKAGLADPCKQQRYEAPSLSSEQEAMISEQIQDGAFSGFVPGEDEARKRKNHILDRIAALPESAKKNLHNDNYRRARPPPADVRHVDTVDGAIVDRSNEPFALYDLNTHVYKIKSLTRNPEYVMIYEIDKLRNHLFDYADDSGRPTDFTTESGKKLKKLLDEKARHMAAAKSKIEARNKTEGDK